MPPIVRTVLHAAVIAVSAAAILFPESRDAARPLVVLLFFIMAADLVVEGLRSGHLRMTLGELVKNPPRTGPIELAANAFGTIALVLVL